MSCGKPHETDCRDVLAEVYMYLDLECDESRRSVISTHLDECTPCLREYGLEESVKKLVHKSCGCDPVPTDLRAKVLVRIQEVRAHLVE